MYPYKTVNFTDECYVCSECSTSQLFPFLFSSSWPHYFLRHINIVIRPITNPILACKCSSKRESHKSLNLNKKKKLKLVKFKEVMSKAKLRQKLGFLC